MTGLSATPTCSSIEELDCLHCKNGMDPIDRLLRSNVKLRHLQLLVALDQFRHLGRAAAFLSQTQPAVDRKSTRLNSSHNPASRMPSSA
jgi:hypothetical protein